MSEQNQTTFQCISSFIFLTHPTVLLSIQKITQAQILEIRIETLDGETIWQKNNGHIIDKINFQKLVVIMTKPIDVRKFSATINESNFKHSITKITGVGAGRSGSQPNDNQYTGPRKAAITLPREVKLEQLYKATEKEVKDMGFTALNKPGTSEKVEATGPDGTEVVAAVVALPVKNKDPRKFAFMAVPREKAGIINKELKTVFGKYTV